MKVISIKEIKQLLLDALENTPIRDGDGELRHEIAMIIDFLYHAQYARRKK